VGLAEGRGVNVGDFVGVGLVVGFGFADEVGVDEGVKVGVGGGPFAITS
jgi:hypothetical protein